MLVGRGYYLRIRVAPRATAGSHSVRDRYWQSPGSRCRHFYARNETIARLPSVKYRTIGLADCGKPGNFRSRQVLRLTGQNIGDVEADRDFHMDKLIDWTLVNQA